MKTPAQASDVIDIYAVPHASTEGVDLRSLPPSADAGDEFARIFEHSLDMLCIAGTDGYFKTLNPAWKSSLGWTPAELMARRYLEFVHPEDRENSQWTVELLAAGGAITMFENRFRHKDGSYRWLQWNARSVPGRPLIYSVARDITRQKWLEREVIQIADREKERLGRDLHDGLCQSLAGIAALSATVSRTLAASRASSASEAVAEITGLLHEAIEEARALARGLGPVGLAEGGLEGALDTLVCAVRHRHRVCCDFSCDRGFPRLHQEVEPHLFRIAQEAISNAISHGRAQQIGIDLRFEDGIGRLRIADNGSGIPEQPFKRDGSGLHTMACRARLIGGTLELSRRAEGGTAVICSFPLAYTPSFHESPHHAHNRA